MLKLTHLLVVLKPKPYCNLNLLVPLLHTEFSVVRMSLTSDNGDWTRGCRFILPSRWLMPSHRLSFAKPLPPPSPRNRISRAFL